MIFIQASPSFCSLLIPQPQTPHSLPQLRRPALTPLDPMLPIPITFPTSLPRRHGSIPRRPIAHRAHLPRAAGSSLQARSGGPAVSIAAASNSSSRGIVVVVEGGARPSLHLDAFGGAAAVAVLVVGFEGFFEGVGGFAFAFEVVGEVGLASY